MTLRTCSACGFENAERDRDCPLCGSTAIDPEGVGATATDVVSSTRGPAGIGGAETGGPGIPAMPRVGQLFTERYQVGSVLGQGGMGQVFRVRDLVHGCDRALKVMASHREGVAHGARFKREIAALRRVEHRAVPRLCDWGVLGEQVYFVSELVEGHDLKTEIQQNGPWPPERAAELAATVADALEAAHGAGVIHRDVKPNNIMLGRDGSVMLVDFGLARGGGIDIATVTRTGVIVGTPGYMSPEQFDGLDVDPTTDVYSLGVVLFELLTGRLPFVSNTPIGIAMLHKSEPPPLPRTLNPEVPPWLERIVLRCLEKDRGRRFPAAEIVAAELRKMATGRPRWRRLSTGDSLLERPDPGGAALELSSSREKRGWSPGLALAFQGRHYKLREVISPSDARGRWRYRFEDWPGVEAFRRLVDYDEDCALQAEPPARGSRLLGWLGGREPKGS